MLFHTWTYLLIFLPSVFFLYFFVIKKIKIPFEYLLIGAGIFFYAAWNIYLTPLILFSIICNYYLGNLIREQTDSIKKKRVLFYFQQKILMRQNWNNISFRKTDCGRYQGNLPIKGLIGRLSQHLYRVREQWSLN